MKVTTEEVREAFKRVRLDVRMLGEIGSGQAELEEAMSQCEMVGTEIMLSMFATATLQDFTEDRSGVPSMIRLMRNRALLRSPVIFALLGYRLAKMHDAEQAEAEKVTA